MSDNTGKIVFKAEFEEIINELKKHNIYGEISIDDSYSVMGIFHSLRYYDGCVITYSLNETASILGDISALDTMLQDAHDQELLNKRAKILRNAGYTVIAPQSNDDIDAIDF